MFLYLILSAVLIIADQLVKLWIVNNFSLHDGMQFINGIVSLLYVRNTGAAWGMFEGKMFFFYAITAIAVGTLLYLMFIIDSICFYFSWSSWKFYRPHSFRLCS